MNHEQKLAWLHKMTKMGLEHVSMPDPDGVQHLDAGGLLGNITNPLGLSNTFSPGSASIQNPATVERMNTAYDTSQVPINQSVANANNLNPSIVQGVRNQNTLEANLSTRAEGRGPNPAQAALNQSTGRNIAQTAALLASQRGAGGNVGLAGENAARAGADIQQQAIGQGATLQAQQEIAAQQELNNLANQQINQGLGATNSAAQIAQGQENILNNANIAATNAAVSQQSNQNQIGAQVAGQNAQANQGLFGGITSAAAGLLSGAGAGLFAQGGMVKMDRGGNVLDANARKHIAPENFALPGRRYPIHDENHARNALARVSQYGTPAEKARVKAAVHAKYPSMGNRMAEGGMAKNSNLKAQLPASQSSVSKSEPMMLAEGAYMAPIPLVVQQPMAGGPQSYLGQYLNSQGSMGGSLNMGSGDLNLKNDADFGKSLGALGKAYKDGQPYEDAETKSLGEFIQNQGSGQMAGSTPEEMGPSTADTIPYELMKSGGKVKAKDGSEKAHVPGNSLKNDKIPAELSEGEGVIDRETMNDPGQMGQMARAVMAHVEKKKKGKK